MDKLREMEIFVAIVDRGSFTGAAEKVGMSPAAVSRAVNSLETRLGTHLLARTTRSVRPTDAGMAYLEACRKLARRAGVSIRTLDKALWQYSKELSNSNRRERDAHT